jgi:integrase
MRKARLSVIRRPKCRGWYIRPTVGGRSEWVFLSDIKPEAERLALDYDRQRILKRVEGLNLQADIALVIEKYLKEKFSTTLTTERSQQRYEVVIRRLQEFVKKYPIVNVSEITREIIADYLNMRNETIAGKTWNMDRAVLYNFFRYCLDNNWLIANPVAKIPPKKVALPHVEHLNAEEAQELLSYVEGHRGRLPYYEVIATLLYTGMRVNEALHLTKEDVLLEKNLLVVQEKVIKGKLWTPKTKARRFVPIPAILKPIIESRLKTKNALLFHNTKGNLVKDRLILEKVKRSCAKAELKVVHTHSLRHTFCSVSSEKGIPELFIQAVLGHKTADMTARYRHLRPDFLGEQFKDFGYGQKKKGVI